jgi:hypothetical protein
VRLDGYYIRDWDREHGEAKILDHEVMMCHVYLERLFKFNMSFLKEPRAHTDPIIIGAMEFSLETLPKRNVLARMGSLNKSKGVF